jgi:hypothetical protein
MFVDSLFSLSPMASSSPITAISLAGASNPAATGQGEGPSNSAPTLQRPAAPSGLIELAGRETIVAYAETAHLDLYYSSGNVDAIFGGGGADLADLFVDTSTIQQLSESDHLRLMYAGEFFRYDNDSYTIGAPRFEFRRFSIQVEASDSRLASDTPQPLQTIDISQFPEPRYAAPAYVAQASNSNVGGIEMMVSRPAGSESAPMTTLDVAPYTDARSTDILSDRADYARPVSFDLAVGSIVATSRDAGNLVVGMGPRRFDTGSNLRDRTAPAIHAPWLQSHPAQPVTSSRNSTAASGDRHAENHSPEGNMTVSLLAALSAVPRLLQSISGAEVTSVDRATDPDAASRDAESSGAAVPFEATVAISVRAKERTDDETDGDPKLASTYLFGPLIVVAAPFLWHHLRRRESAKTSESTRRQRREL